MVNGEKREIILSNICIQDEARYEPIVQLNDTEYLLDNRVIYNIKKNNSSILELPLSYINYAELNKAKDKIAYVGKNEKTCSFDIGYINLDDFSYELIYSIDPMDWKESFSPALYVSWKNNNKLFFDAPSEGVPTIYEINIQTMEKKLVKSNARIPVSIDEGSILAYLSTDTFGGHSNIELETVVESNTGKKIKLPGYRVLKSDDKGKLYIAGYGELVTVNTKELTLESTKEMEPYFNFVSVKNGVLEYQKVIVSENNEEKVEYKKVKVIE